MEQLNILYIADTTISGGTFQTPFLYCLRKVRNAKALLQCLNHHLSNCQKIKKNTFHTWFYAVFHSNSLLQSVKYQSTVCVFFTCEI
jgi:hypothetical protein